MPPCCVEREKGQARLVPYIIVYFFGMSNATSGKVPLVIRTGLSYDRKAGNRKGRTGLDTRPIGIFDSGLGGLTTVRALTRLMPEEDYIYFGDTGRVPYGGRSRETIIKYARQDVAFLRSFDLKAIVIACGTVSTTSMEVLTAENPQFPIVGVAQPAAEAAAKLTRNGKIGLIGTQASIRSGVYEQYIAAARPGTTVIAEACPLFVPLVENGRFRPGDIVIETVAAEYLRPLKEAGIDTLILGCTHYPLLEDVIRAYMGETVTLVDAGASGAQAARELLTSRDALAPAGRKGTGRFYVSDTVDGFAHTASLFLQRDIAGQVNHVDIGTN